MDNSNNAYNVDNSYNMNNTNIINSQDGLNNPEKPKKSFSKVPIIIAAVFLVLSVLIVRLFASFFAGPEPMLKTEADVVDYLTSKYRDESFEVASKNDSKWVVRSTKSHISFEVSEHKRYASGGLSRDKYVAEDNYVEMLHKKFISSYRSNSLTVKTESSSYDDKYILYKNGAPLTSDDITSSVRDEIFRLCDNMNNSYPFAASSITFGAYYDSNPDSKYHSFDNSFPPLTLHYTDKNSNKEKSLYCYPRTKSYEAMEDVKLVK